MTLGSNLAQARKRNGLSQEDVAEKLGVSRQTISKWELNETLPDICQAKKLAMLYHMTLDELIAFDLQLQEMQRLIDDMSEEVQEKIDWNQVWSKKYPILAAYQQTVDIDTYAFALKELLAQLRRDYGYSQIDACLVLKDILGQVWKS